MTMLYARLFDQMKHEPMDPVTNFYTIKIENVTMGRKSREELQILKQKEKDSSELMNIQNRFKNYEVFHYALKNCDVSIENAIHYIAINYYLFTH